MNKRFISFLLVIFSLVGLVACTGEIKDTTPQESDKPIINYVTDEDGQTVAVTEENDTTDTAGGITSETEKNISSTQKPKDDDTTSKKEDTDKSTEDSKPNNSIVPEGERISVLCAGDNIIHEAVFTYAKTLAGGKGYDFEPIYRDILPYVKNADVAFINQESPICGDELGISGYPAFNSPEVLGDFLIDSGFDVIGLANNHTFDKLQKGYDGMMSYWEDKDVITVGAYKNKADYNDIRVLEKDGVRIAFLAYTDFINSSKYAKYDSSKATIAFTDRDEIKRQVKEAKKIADIVVVSMHWGDEDEFGITSSQKKTANAIAEAGADVIIGHHPHVVGKIEWLNDGKTLCMYSLGNLLSTMHPIRNLVSTMVSFDIVKGKDGFEIENVKCIPTVTYYEYDDDMRDENRKNIKVYLMEDFTEDLAKSHGSNEKESSEITLKRIKKYITDNISSKFLD